jgi:hypothetical protein
MCSNYDKNKQDVLGSAIAAKATIKRNGIYEFLIVFEKSTMHEFYWVFQARSMRSPRKSWKFGGLYFGRTNGGYTDFGSFIAYYLSTKTGSELIQTRIPKRKLLASLYGKMKHESIHADWGEQDLSKMTFDLLEKKFESKLKGHFPSQTYYGKRQPVIRPAVIGETR